ncbi:hypothetical protein C8J57DRAFT_1727205 [Mycena rebaudengoi]|nr:hypothetical protein C8J57DRAFT_1727205 [Mycena rebaudengoi]
MVNLTLIHNITAAATAATMVGIWDFNKKNAFNLVNSACNDYTPVNIRLANFEPINQACWVLAGGPFTFQFITRCGTFLTYPNQFWPLAVANQATTRPTASATTSWMVSLVDPATPTGPWNILEPTSGAALTAWSQDPAQVVNSGAPITLEVANPKDTRQQFWFTSSVISTPITELFGIKHPILLAGMNVAAGPELAAAVSNAGGLGVIGGLGYTPKFLREQIRAVKDGLVDKSLPFGVDLLIPKVGGSARKTNYDYTKGKLAELIEVIIEEKTSPFVCAVGVPPKSAVDRLHEARIPIMNMVGHPKHVAKALAAGVDIICVQAGEGGGHTGDIPASILIRACVDAVSGHKSALNGKPVYVMGAGAVYDNTFD